MVCFVVHILLPKKPRACNNIALQRQVEHLVRHQNGHLCREEDLESSKYYEIRICDEDTIALLRDFPAPFTVLKIDYLQSGENLFTYRNHKSPPRIPLLKTIYWSAKSTERWNLPISNELSQTK